VAWGIWSGDFGGVVRGVAAVGIGRDGRLGSGRVTAGPGGEAVRCWWSTGLAWAGDWAAKFDCDGVVVSASRALWDTVEFLAVGLIETEQWHAFMMFIANVSNLNLFSLSFFDSWL
jgi:hypothetical protein